MRLIAAVASTLTLLFALPTSAATARSAAPAAAAPSGTLVDDGFDLSNASLAGWIGFELGDLDGVYLRADGAMPIVELAPQVNLLGVVSLGFTHLGQSSSWYSISWNILTVAASARGQWDLAPSWDIFADAGLGFYYGGWSSETDALGGTYEADDTTGGMLMRFAAGGHYELAPSMKIGAELGFIPYFGDAETTNFFMGAGFQYDL